MSSVLIQEMFMRLRDRKGGEREVTACPEAPGSR